MPLSDNTSASGTPPKSSSSPLKYQQTGPSLAALITEKHRQHLLDLRQSISMAMSMESQNTPVRELRRQLMPMKSPDISKEAHGLEADSPNKSSPIPPCG